MRDAPSLPLDPAVPSSDPTHDQNHSPLVLLHRLMHVHHAMYVNHAHVAALSRRSEYYLQLANSLTASLRASLESLTPFSTFASTLAPLSPVLDLPSLVAVTPVATTDLSPPSTAEPSSTTHHPSNDYLLLSDPPAASSSNGHAHHRSQQQSARPNRKKRSKAAKNKSMQTLAPTIKLEPSALSHPPNSHPNVRSRVHGSNIHSTTTSSCSLPSSVKGLDSHSTAVSTRSLSSNIKYGNDPARDSNSHSTAINTRSLCSNSKYNNGRGREPGLDSHLTTTSYFESCRFKCETSVHSRTEWDGREFRDKRHRDYPVSRLPIRPDSLMGPFPPSVAESPASSCITGSHDEAGHSDTITVSGAPKDPFGNGRSNKSGVRDNVPPSGTVAQTPSRDRLDNGRSNRSGVHDNVSHSGTVAPTPSQGTLGNGRTNKSGVWDNVRHFGTAAPTTLKESWSSRVPASTPLLQPADPSTVGTTHQPRAPVPVLVNPSTPTTGSPGHPVLPPWASAVVHTPGSNSLQLSAYSKAEPEPELHINIGSNSHAVYVPQFLETLLQGHQVQGISFLWKRVVIENGGAILAHAMGLGKSVQIIAFLYILYREIRFNQLECAPNIQRRCFLILCPKTVYPNWVNEINKWIPIEYQRWVGLAIYVLDNSNKLYHEGLLEHWHKLGGILVASYGCFKATIVSKRLMLEDCQRESRLIEAIVKKSSLVIIDEAHVAKNNKTALCSLLKTNLPSDSLCIGLTGTPLANNLDEYYRLADLVAPGYLGPPSHFEIIRDRIMKGQVCESSAGSRRAAEYGLELLSHTLDEFVCRVDNTVLVNALPPMEDVVIYLEPTDMQKEVIVSILLGSDLGTGVRFLEGLRLIGSLLNHPGIVVQKVLGNLSRVIADKNVASVFLSRALANKLSEGDAISDQEDNIAPDPESATFTLDSLTVKDTATELPIRDWIDKHKLQHGHFGSPELSSKTMFMLDLVQESVKLNEKVIVFSHSLGCLDLLAYLIQLAGYKYCVLVGSMNSNEREASIAQFNAVNIEYPVMLASTRTGSTGINLVRASRVIIFDFDFNPIHEEQALSRAFRIGQTRPVFVYRFVNPDTVNDIVFKNQVNKSLLARQTLDHDRFYRMFYKSDLKLKINKDSIIRRMQRPVDRVGVDMQALDPVLSHAVRQSPYVTSVELMRTYFPSRSQPELDQVLIQQARARAAHLRQFIRSGLLKSAQFEVPPDNAFMDSELCNFPSVANGLLFTNVTLPSPSGPGRDYVPSSKSLSQKTLGDIAHDVINSGTSFPLSLDSTFSLRKTMEEDTLMALSSDEDPIMALSSDEDDLSICFHK